ncbi:N-acetylmuramoyl-L-alanine amidase [Streptacidiphilus fuscans]|uniref:N-acetylmuramoyl-L-alanine amidase n=1 Tax=Streptacidiphilus fuscans TaxID=2789292 RepID=A0A931AXT7_9ACTN|nr:N-acetylmuramoyl-L-alanine amidase [Streptacidiphilus fuscans]MBF9066834.1 N-acetylmuramoyl-L-alanine amidase [Streptacidiphilus fuscans]
MHVERRLLMRRVAQVALVGGVTTVLVRGSTAPAPSSTPARVFADPVDLHWTAAQPAIIRRADWDTIGRNKPLPAPHYADAVKAIFIHHTDSGNEYDLADVPSIIWSMKDDQTGRRGWDDIGYNFLVDRFGNIYEGRHGGVDRPVIGAQCSGFNVNSAGIAAIGTFTEGADVPAPMLQSLSALCAWKLSLHGVDALSTTVLTCSDSLSRFPAGSRATFAVISGHTDADCTYCPGSALYAALPGIRRQAAQIQQNTDHPVFGNSTPVLQPKPTATPSTSPGR